MGRAGVYLQPLRLEDVDVVPRDRLVAGDQGQALDGRLRHQHAIERVAMVRWESPGGDHMGIHDRQLTEAHVPYPFGEVGRAGELSRGLLDGDLPQADRGQEDVGIVAQPVEEFLVQGGIGGDGPQRDVGVQQQALLRLGPARIAERHAPDLRGRRPVRRRRPADRMIMINTGCIRHYRKIIYVCLTLLGY